MMRNWTTFNVNKTDTADGGTQLHNSEKYLPTQEEIAIACEEIRSTWDKKEYKRRTSIGPKAAIIQIIKSKHLEHRTIKHERE